MNAPGYAAAVVAKARAGGVHGAELAALRRRLRQLGEQQAGLLPGDVLQPLADLPRLEELPEPSPAQVRDVLDRIDLRAVKDLQAADPAAPDLPLIVNRKSVDPRDPESTPVIQLESAMGAAVGSIPGAQVVHVPRSRFAPVKTTDDLLLVRSDAYELTSDGQMRPSFDGQEPLVTLDEDYYRLLPDFEQRFPAGAPSLRRCRRFEAEGDVTFGAGVVARGEVRVTGPRRVPDREVLGQ